MNHSAIQYAVDSMEMNREQVKDSPTAMKPVYLHVSTVAPVVHESVANKNRTSPNVVILSDVKWRDGWLLGSPMVWEGNDWVSIHPSTVITDSMCINPEHVISVQVFGER